MTEPQKLGLELLAIVGLISCVLIARIILRCDVARFRRKAKAGKRCRVKTRFGAITGTIARRDEHGRVLVDGDTRSIGTVRMAYLEWHDLEDIYPI